MATVEINELRKSFGDVETLHGISFSIPDGAFVALVGPSGCGKSTILRLVAGLEEITSGDIYIGDNIINDIEPKDRNIAMVFQNYALYPHLTVAQNMGFSLKLLKKSKVEIERAVKEAAEILGIGELLHRLPKQLSGGQRQRVSIARALACDPSLLVLDEPTSALDVLVQARVLRLLNKLRAKHDLSYIFITHDLAVVRNVADRVAVFQSGRLVELGKTEQIFSAPEADYTRRLIGAVPVVDEAELNLRNQLAEGL